MRDLQDALLPKFRYAENHRPKSEAELSEEEQTEAGLIVVPPDPFLQAGMADLPPLPNLPADNVAPMLAVKVQKPMAEQATALSATSIPSLRELRPLRASEPSPVSAGTIPTFESLRPLGN